jgi:hypothetical protein
VVEAIIGSVVLTPSSPTGVGYETTLTVASSLQRARVRRAAK